MSVSICDVTVLVSFLSFLKILSTFLDTTPWFTRVTTLSRSQAQVSCSLTFTSSLSDPYLLLNVLQVFFHHLYHDLLLPPPQVPLIFLHHLDPLSFLETPPQSNSSLKLSLRISSRHSRTTTFPSPTPQTRYSSCLFCSSRFCHSRCFHQFNQHRRWFCYWDPWETIDGM